MPKTAIVVHHSLTKDGATVSWDAIRRFHVVEQGWRAIGYHFGIERIGETVEVLIGRMPDDDAAAVKENGLNRTAIHVCLVGNFDEAPVPPEQWKKAVELIAWIARAFHIPTTRIYGHRDFNPKSCPGTNFDLKAFRVDVANLNASIKG